MATIRVMKDAFVLFKKNDPLRMAAATAFFTMFAFPPILIILIHFFGLVIDPGALSNEIFRSLAVTLGRSGVRQIRDTLHGFQSLARNWYIAAGGFIFLLFVATTLFKVIKDSLNQLWDIRSPRTATWAQSFLPRLRSVIMILLGGILLLSELASEGMLALMRNYVNGRWAGTGSVLFLISQQGLSLIVVTVWFVILFKYLPDGSFSWRTVIAGAFFTGILFTTGKLLLGWLLAYSNIKSIYGASGSFVIVLLFLFYVSMIFYYGASYTAAFAVYKEDPISQERHTGSTFN